MPATADKLLPLSRVARLLSVSRACVREWVRGGQFPAPVRLPGGERRWRESEVAGWISGLNSHVAPGPKASGPTLAPPWPHSGPTPGAEDFSALLEQLKESAPEILEALSEKDGWVLGADLAKAAFGDESARHTGTWRRASKQLRELGLIETDRELGFRLTEFARSNFRGQVGPD